MLEQDRHKYRVWSIDDDCYIEDMDIIRLTHSGKFVFNEKEEPQLKPKKFLVEKCIGLRDKRGKLIYEKDIIANRFMKLFVIEWCQEKLGYVARNKNPNENLESLDISDETWVIVGNVHENPEFLEVLDAKD